MQRENSNHTDAGEEDARSLGPLGSPHWPLPASHLLGFNLILPPPNSPFAGAVSACFSLFGSVWKVQAHFFKSVSKPLIVG